MNTSPAIESAVHLISQVKDEGTIQFRPSPNFKHMKKYLKSKFEEDMISSAESEATDKVNDKVQPPLPPNSPPPDSPPPGALTLVKQERPDEGYEPAAPAPALAPAPVLAPVLAPALAPAAAAAAAAAADEPRRKPVMCKDFVRKTCTRGAACIYAHEVIHAQLKDVYKFCRDYENGRCNRPVCYFVHATTFEKEHYHRSAYLPPHAFAHLATPQQSAVTDGVTELTFNNPPPQPLQSAATPVSVASESASAAVPAAVPVPPSAPAPACAAPLSLKREWRDIDDCAGGGGAAREPGGGAEPPAKLCKRCDLTDLRLAAARGRVAAARRGARDLDEQLDSVLARGQRMHAALRALLKPRRVLEHVRSNFLTTRLLGDAPDGDQMKVLLAKILLGGEAPAEGATPGS